LNTAPRLEDLAQIEAAVWRELQAAVSHHDHAWRVGVLATFDGNAADARCVVLRELATRTLLIYTDARSPKARHITAHPSGVLVLWSEALGWQLRVQLDLSLQTAGLAVSSRWARMKMTPAAHDYLSPLAPGSTLAQAPRQVAPQIESRDHFAVIAAEVLALDWLELDARGHRRAMFDAAGPRWVAP
jgi:hypothetical protein